MTWIMFDNIILNPENGSHFCRLYADVRYYNPIGNEKLLESFRSEELALQRFEELQKMLIRKPRYVMKDDGSLQNILSEEL